MLNVVYWYMSIHYHASVNLVRRRVPVRPMLGLASHTSASLYHHRCIARITNTPNTELYLIHLLMVALQHQGISITYLF
jgi:hypothetical protein